MKGNGRATKPEPGSAGVEQATAMNEGMRVLSHLIAGTGVYGALGWVGDHFLHTAFLLPLGIVLGAGLGIYTSIKRFGLGFTPAATEANHRTTAAPVSTDPTTTRPAKEDAR